MEFILRKGSNMKKRFICLALVMVMIFTLLPMSAFAADVVASGTCGAEGDNLTWTLDSEGTLTISGTGAMTDYTYSSGSTNAPWFNSRSSIKSVIIENGVTSIGDWAFYNCSSLVSVTIPDSVSSIGDYAFRGCSSVQSVTIGNGVTSIGEEAFSYCSSLVSVTIPDSVTSIGGWAFYNCIRMTSVTIPDSVTSIGISAFRYCEYLKYVYYRGDIVSWLGISFEENFSNPCCYGANLYFNGKLVTDVIISDSVTSIGDYAFKNCSSLTSVTFSNGVASIGEYAFYKCSNLTNVYYGGSEEQWKQINIKGANECLTNAMIHYNSTSPHELNYTSAVTAPTCTEKGYTTYTCSCGSSYVADYKDALGHNYENGKCTRCGAIEIINSGTCGENLTWTFGGEGTLTISGTGAMDDYSSDNQPWYSDIDNIKSVVIDNGVTSVGDYAFYSCDSLVSVTIPDSVTSIGDCAFCACYSLTSATIPDSVTSIGVKAFYGCNSLTSMTIGNSVTSIGDSAFYNCTGLTSVTISDSVTSIGDSAFSGCDSLTSVTIPDSVTSIGANAFESCDELTSVTIGISVTSIGSYAFRDCRMLKEINYNAKAVADLTDNSNVFENAGKYRIGAKVTFGEKVKKIPNYLFSTYNSYYSPNINEIVFLGNAPAIGSKSFNRVTAVAYYPYGNDAWTSVVKYNYGGQITWKPYSNAEVTSVVCNGKTSYFLGDELDTSSISVTIERSDGCVETYNYASGKITLGEYDMSKSGEQSIVVTCRDVTTQFNIYVHGLASETMPANDYPESSHNYEDNLDKTYTYTADGAYSLDVTFSSDTETEANIDYIYVNGTKYTGKELANKTVHINGDTLTVRLVSDGSDSAYGFSIDSIVATYFVHKYTDTVVAPTCTEQGYTTHTCVCGDNYMDSYVDALGHDLVHHDGKTATCTEKGWEAYDTCSRCDYTTYKEISALGHSFGEWTETTAPTCTEKGVETRYCSRCDATETREVDALGHNLVHHDGKAATCTEKGWEAYDTCSRCDYTTYKELPATGHNYTSTVTAPTCTEKGYTTYTCSCGDSYVADYKDALGHDLVHHDGKAATCTEKGWEAYDTCSRCDYTTYKEIPATGHNYTSTVTAPTCTEKGYTTYTCSCGDSYVADYKDALGHDFGEWTVTTAPTCTEKGVETRYCSRCDATETRDVDALGHDLVHHDGKAATCTEKGWEAYDTCSRCDYTTYKEIPATGHNYTSSVTAPTCTEKGYTTYTCSCSDSYVADYKDALGHDYKDGVCTVCGAKDPDYKPPVKENPFVDVSESSVYYDAILWAYYHEPQQITGGYTATEFRPGNPCTRGQVVTFLWRAAGCPEPTGDINVFNDASSIAAPYRKAVAWAVEKGITTGFTDGTFRPNDSVTRAQFVTFLWRYENKPATSGSIAGFTDAASISGPYQQAVAWAVEKGITTGYNDGSFRPNSTCTRWAVVLFMYRDMN